MRDFWEQLNRREQNIILFGGIAALCLLIYALIWSPISNSLDKNQQYIQSQKTLVHWMSEAYNKIETLKQTGLDVSTLNMNQPLNQLIRNQIRQSQLSRYVKNIHTIDQSTVSVQLINIPFDRFIQTLQHVHKRFPIEIKHIHIMRKKTIGLVDVDLTLYARAG